MTTGDYLPNIRRMAICQERSISLADVRATGMEQVPHYASAPLVIQNANNYNVLLFNTMYSGYSLFIIKQHNYTLCPDEK